MVSQEGIRLETASQKLERRFVDQILGDLAWPDVFVRRGDDPPDFVIEFSDGRLASLEVTRIYRREGPRGSPEAERERAYERCCKRIADAYYRRSGVQPIKVDLQFPPYVDSPSVRNWTAQELEREHRVIEHAASDVLSRLPSLAELEEHRFEVRLAHGRFAKFRVTRLPERMKGYRHWRILNNNLGWRSSVAAERIQEKIRQKAKDLQRYRTEFQAAYLLIVADAHYASGYLDLAPDVRIDLVGFDSVFFQRSFDFTRQISTLD